MSRVLLTGGAGFIGSHIADRLLANGHEVIVVDDLSGGFMENVPAGAEFHCRGVEDDLDDLFLFRKVDHIIHAAAYAAEGLSHFIRGYNYRNNLLGSVSLINLAARHRVESFVFLSSIAVYGHGAAGRGGEFEEVEVPMPCDPYGIAKYAVELDLRAAWEMWGLPFVIFRPHNVYGPRQNIGDAYRNVVGIFMNQCLRGEEMTIFGDGSQTRAFSHIRDVAVPIADCLGRGEFLNEVFNIGGDVPCSVLELAGEVAGVMGVEPRIRHLEARREVRHAIADHGRLRRVLGERMPVALGPGLRDMAAWVREHGARETRPFAGIEVERGMPASWAALGMAAAGGVLDERGPA